MLKTTNIGMDNWSYVGATNVENDQHSATTNVGATKSSTSAWTYVGATNVEKDQH